MSSCENSSQVADQFASHSRTFEWLACVRRARSDGQCRRWSAFVKRSARSEFADFFRRFRRAGPL